MAVAKQIDIESDEYKLGQRIRKYRINRGLSQTQLGNIIDMDRSAISNYENGMKGEMGFRTFLRFADALGVSLDDLAGKEPPQHEDVLRGLNEENKKTICKLAEALYLQQTMTA